MYSVSIMHEEKQYWFQDGKLKVWNRINKKGNFSSHKSMTENEAEKFIDYIEKRFRNELGKIEIHISNRNGIQIHSWKV